MKNRVSDIYQYKAVIFDMDGLLLDSERLYIDAYEVACLDLNVRIELSLMMSTYGTNEVRTLEIFTKHFGNSNFAEKMLNQISENYHNLISEKPIELMPGVLRLLNYIRSKEIPMAVATSTPYNSATTKLADSGVLDFFKLVVAGNQVSNSKPDPEIYLRAATRLEATPESCLAFEDSDNGVKSAYAAGMTVIQIPNLAPPCEEVIAFKHLVLPSLDSVAELFGSD